MPLVKFSIRVDCNPVVCVRLEAMKTKVSHNATGDNFPTCIFNIDIHECGVFSAVILSPTFVLKLHCVCFGHSFLFCVCFVVVLCRLTSSS